MDKWQGKTAVVTGASAGIGAEIVKDLARNGINVVGLARRPEMIEEFAKEIEGTGFGKIYAYKCDVSSLDSIKETFKWIEDKFGVINILVNNAGIGKKTTILNDNHEVDNHFVDIINTNFTGLVHVTRHAYLLMKKSEDFCKIINICSITGHNVMSFMNNFEGQEANVYHGTKHAVKATTEILRQELIALKNDKIRVSSVSPGIVETDFFHAGKFIAETDKIKDVSPALNSSDVSSVILYLLQIPYHVNITEVIIKSVMEPF
ncbi:hypothetical protein ACKWTF_003396 [Chironomus riparius]